MKEYRTNEELINYLSSKGVIIANKEEALQKVVDNYVICTIKIQGNLYFIFIK